MSKSKVSYKKQTKYSILLALLCIYKNLSLWHVFRCLAVLKNVNKIERFIIDQLRKMLDDELVFPSYQCVQMS
jgi:hypothetical protein